MLHYNSFFRQWGDKFTDLPRYALPLVNKNGRLDNNPEPVCWPLDRWNFVNLGYEDTPEDFTKFYKDIQNNINTDDLEFVLKLFSVVAQNICKYMTFHIHQRRLL